jgi:hypothetical protein
MKPITYELSIKLNINKHKHFIQTQYEVTYFMGYCFEFYKGFVTDGCSYPVIIQKILIKIFGIKKIKKGRSDCKIHDAAYSSQYPKKPLSDLILLFISFKTSPALAIIKYTGVFFGGHYSYYNHSKLDEYNQSYCKITKV